MLGPDVVEGPFIVRILPNRIPVGAINGDHNGGIVILTPLNIQPAPELQPGLNKTGAINRRCGQPVGLRHIVRVVPTQVVSIDILPGMGRGRIGVGPIRPALSGRNPEGPIRLSGPARVGVKRERIDQNRHGRSCSGNRNDRGSGSRRRSL